MAGKEERKWEKGIDVTFLVGHGVLDAYICPCRWIDMPYRWEREVHEE